MYKTTVFLLLAWAAQYANCDKAEDSSESSKEQERHVEIGSNRIMRGLCYQCDGEACNQGLCKGRWCKKSIIYSGYGPDNGKVVKYRCENTPNLARGCYDVRMWGYDVHQCFCNDGDFCTSMFDYPDEDYEEDEPSATAKNVQNCLVIFMAGLTGLMMGLRLQDAPRYILTVFSFLM